MKQLRLILLLLVTFVAQAAMAQEKELRPLTEKDGEIIEKAILEKDIDKLEEYWAYDIAKVDSTIAMESRKHKFMAFCIIRHNMTWPLKYMDLGRELALGYFPNNLYKSAFYMPTDGEIKYKMLEYVYEKCDSVVVGGEKGSFVFWNFIQGLYKRSPVASLAMLVMAQAFGQNNLAYGNDFTVTLNKYMATYMGKIEKKTKKDFNKRLEKFLVINGDGSVKMKFTLPVKSAAHDDNYKNSWNQAIVMYETLAQLISESCIADPFVEEVFPTFPGGDEALFKFLNGNIQYPAEAIEKGIKGYVVVGFTIAEDGSVTDVKVLKSVHHLLTNEAIRVVSLMPKWKPGRQLGDSIKVKYQVPLTFGLTGK